MAIDIDQSFYNTGTASVDNGGTIVTGQGTQWISSIRANDIFGTHKGDGVRILSVESNTSLTLAYPWTGETQETAPYEVQFTPYDTGYYPAVRQLLQTMASGNIEAFAALTGAPNRVPIFTGPGAMDLVDPSTFGLQDPNGSLSKLASVTLEANKFLNTNTDRDVIQSDITDAARSLMSTAGTPNSFPYYDSNNSVSNSEITSQSRTMLASATPAVTSLGYTPANRAGDTFSGPITMNVPASDWQFKTAFTVTLANTAGYNFDVGNGMFIVSDTSIQGSCAIYVVGNSVARLIGQSGTIFGESNNNNIFMTHVGGDQYGIANVTGQPVTLQIMNFKTRYT